MKKILFLLVAAICTFAACDPVHEDVSNAGHITLDELIAKTTVSVDKAENGNNGNVVTCKTSAPVNAKWSIDGKEFVGNYAWKKMKVKWDENGDYIKTPYTIVLTALCPDGTQLKAEFPIECDEITNPLTKYYIYPRPGFEEEDKPFQPGAWDAAAMRFSSSEGAHLPTISDDVYFGLKTLILDISDAENCDLKVMNGWWSNTYYDHVKLVSGLNEIQITETMAKECAKGNGGEGRDLDLMLYSGTMTLNAVYYEE
ncbi:hypothetical protein [Prevotella sp. E2-28]|uniref:hypothetical protein n=1 Tax=Prevotella sp. E2-28 TaxID=2913620 RepID=UPI001EDB88A5|nr:hypothetical protein [Prevotella sp. E2-28]UKK54442.1 hypothetical protein L6465_04055 [Prevotella sp. E2-28]